MKDEEIIFTSKEELDKYDTKLLLGFVDYLNKLGKKNHRVFHCCASVQIVDEESLIKDFIGKVGLK